MPIPNIKSFAKEVGVSEDKIEKYWNKAKGIAEEELGKKEKDFGDKEWSYVMGIVKNMAGIKESTNIEEDEAIKERVNIFFETELNAKAFIEKKCKKEEEEPEEDTEDEDKDSIDEGMTSGSFSGLTPTNPVLKVDLYAKRKRLGRELDPIDLGEEEDEEEEEEKE